MGWKLGRRPALDGLRGVAVLLVVGSHFDTGQQLTGSGVMGVEMFFALSGFLITSLLLEEVGDTGRIGFRDFYIRRALRLGPALLVVLLTASCLQLAGLPLDLAPGMVVASLLYVSNWYLMGTADAGSVHWNALGHTWSLSIEEQFYIAWPLLLVAAARWRGRQGVLLVASGGAVASLAVWASTGRAALATDVSAWGLLVGCALAALMHGAHERRPTVVLTLPVLALVPLSTVDTFYSGPSWGHVLVPLATVIAIWVAVQRGVRWLEMPWLRWVGQRSYGLYLWHSLIGHVISYLNTPRPIAVAIGLALSFALTELSWRLVEQPTLRLKRRYSRIPADDAARLDGRVLPRR